MAALRRPPLAVAARAGRGRGGDRDRAFDWSTSIAPRLVERRGYPERNLEGVVASLERLEQLFTKAS